MCNYITLCYIVVCILRTTSGYLTIFHMIQRIQTVYLIIAVILLGFTFAFPLATITNGNEIFTLTPFALMSNMSDGTSSVVAHTTHMGVLTALTLLLTFINIFLYKHRMIQVRICFALMVMTFGVQIFFGYYIYKMNTDFSTIGYSVTDIFPIITTILIYLAFKGIIRDEMLIKSLNRIR